MRRRDRSVVAGDDAAAEQLWNAVPSGRTRWGRRPAESPPDAEALVDSFDDSAARAEWADRLARYVDQQGAMDALRLRSPSEPPWPQAENPMVGYLVSRGAEIVAERGLDAALEWLATNAWFEGVIAERVRIARLLDDE
jgi:uncharacterized protein (DUF2236 family)